MDLALVIAAAVVGFFFTIVWKAGFSKSLHRGWKQESSNLSIKSPTYLLVSFIGSLWCSYGVFLLIKNIKPAGALEVATIVVGLWLLILVGISAKYYVAAGIHFKSAAIDYIGSLIHLFILAIILSA